MPGPTASVLVRELGNRMREFVLSTPTATGIATTLIDSGLRQYMPVAIPQLNAWVYAGPGSDAANVGLERRAQSWDGLTTITFYPPGWPTAPSVGQYEINVRFQRARLLEAVNESAGQLGLTWFREVVDETLVTAQNVWRYTPPAAQNWAKIQKVEIQINNDTNLVGYPFSDASFLNWRPRRSVDVSGNETWFIDFGLMPPPLRSLRVFGEAYYPDLASDTDILALSGMWRRPALTWIYSNSQFLLTDWTTNAQGSTELEKARQKAMDTLARQKEELLALAPSHRPGRIVTPGRGDGMSIESPEDGAYLGVFKGTAFR